MLLEISKCYNFHPISANIYEDNGYCRQRKILFLALLSFLNNTFGITFRGIRPRCQHILAFLKFKHETQWQHSQMCNILKMVDHRGKGTKLGDLQA